jgi:hypothetical protein
MVNFDARIVQRFAKIIAASSDEVVIYENFANVFFCKRLDRVRPDQAAATNDNKLLSRNIQARSPKMIEMERNNRC